MARDIASSPGRPQPARQTSANPESFLTVRQVITTWWPLAASWALMALELPTLASFVARLPEPAVNLAAYGGIVLPLALLIESPIIQLLSASTALSRDAASYRKLKRFMTSASACLTAVHVLVAFTPLYDLVVGAFLHAPEAARGPGRLALQIMTPWTWSIAYRRFHQGVLIRFGHSRVVGFGTFIRLVVNISVLTIGFWLGRLPGAAVAASGVAAGVMSEALFIGWRVQPVLRQQLRLAPTVEPALDRRSFLAFYVPLALTSLLNLLMEPIGPAALGRMPLALESLAAWPVVIGMIFLAESLGISYTEVVVALHERPGAPRILRRFALGLAASTALGLLLVTATPLSWLWLTRVVGLDPSLATLARQGLWIVLAMPPLAVLAAWLQGILVSSRQTRAIPESLGLFLATASTIAVVGVWWNNVTGLYVGLIALVSGTLAQSAWLMVRSRAVRRSLRG